MQKAKEYRERAQELRDIAQDWIDDGARETLLRLAQQYVRMAEERERLARGARTSS